MMKKLALAGILLITSALANAYTWTQTIDFAPDPQITPLNSFTFTHNLTANGFNPGVDTITDYSLTLNVSNDKGMLDAIYIDQPGLAGDGGAILFNWTYASITTGDSYQGIASLDQSGMLTLSVKSLFGTFYLDSSKLVAVGTQGGSASSVPEPASIALLAAGLFGIGIMRRNNNNKAA